MFAACKVLPLKSATVAGETSADSVNGIKLVNSISIHAGAEKMLHMCPIARMDGIGWRFVASHVLVATRESANSVERLGAFPLVNINKKTMFERLNHSVFW